MPTDDDRYAISTADGRYAPALQETYPTREAAVEALRAVLGWDAIVLGDAFATLDGDGRDVQAWCCYETAEERDADGEGAYAPRITAVSPGAIMLDDYDEFLTEVLRLGGSRAGAYDWFAAALTGGLRPYTIESLARDCVDDERAAERADERAAAERSGARWRA